MAPIRADGLPAMLGRAGWRRFEAEGMVRIGRLDSAALGRLRTGLDDIMLGRADAPYDRLLMQLDSSSGNYGDLGRQTKGFKGATLNYRKIQDLELVATFRSYLEGPPFRNICRHVYGDIPVACFRAMAMIKPAGAGTKLPWHQDRWRALDRDPLVTIWTSLDDANAESGGLEVIPGSHRRGVLNPSHPSAFLDDQQQAQCDGELDRARLDIPAGEVWLLHNWLLHRSGGERDGQAAPRVQRVLHGCPYGRPKRSSLHAALGLTRYADVHEPLAVRVRHCGFAEMRAGRPAYRR